jgi:hypothetical protein
VRKILLSVLTVVGAAAAVRAADLRPGTIAAFDRYVHLTEARVDEELLGRLPFLWIDSLPEPQHRDAVARAMRGDVIVVRLETRVEGHRLESPDSLRHHWVGTAFVPGARLAQVAAVMQSYARYPDMYRPSVRRATVLSRDGDHFVVALQLFTKKIISVVVNTESDVRYSPVGTSRMQIRSTSVRIAEVENAGTPGERELPVGHDDGFMWRFNNYCALEERDRGTYVQCESVSLSRDVPFGLGWIVGSFVSAVPRESLEFTLASLRAAVARTIVR